MWLDLEAYREDGADVFTSMFIRPFILVLIVRFSVFAHVVLLLLSLHS
jgi:hypothetical protein